MNKNVLKSKLIVAVMLVFGITAFISCEKEEEKALKSNDASSIPELTSKQIEYIGEMHNVYVQRAFDDYFVEKKTKSTNDNDVVLDIIDLISFFEQQPESEGISEDEINKIKEFYYNFRTDENSSLNYSEQLFEYLKSNIEAQYGVDYDDIINPKKTKSFHQNKTKNTLTGVAFSVNKNSEEFWRKFHNNKSLKAEGSATITADTGGAVWGLCLGGAVGSIIAGGVASIIANEVEKGEGGPVFDGHIHTPKDI